MEMALFKSHQQRFAYSETACARLYNGTVNVNRSNFNTAPFLLRRLLQLRYIGCDATFYSE